MRWVFLILGMFVLGGCASLSSPQERHERIAKAFKTWWRGGDSSSHSYQDESDDSKAHHEQTIVNTLNGWTGNTRF